MSAQAVLRADASPRLGAGHVRRCMALGAALREVGWDVTFACAPRTVDTVPPLAATGWPVIELDDDADARRLRDARAEGCDLLVVDHYERGADFESACRGWAERIVVVDDLHDRAHDCDLLVDQAPDVAEDDYVDLVPDGCRMLLGPEFALIRDGFARRRMHGGARRRGELRRILVAFGATDPTDATSLALRAIEHSELDVAVDVVLGGASPNVGGVLALASAIGPRIAVHVDAIDVPALVEAADLCIGAAGVGVLERCCLGLPSLLVTIAANQREGAAAVARRGAAEYVGEIPGLEADALADALRALAGDPLRLEEMSARAARICDGLGARRAALEATGGARSRGGGIVRLRPARETDRDLVYQWQRIPAIRRHAREPRPPTRAEHDAWYAAKLDDPRCLMQVISREDEPCGIVRLDPSADRDGFEVSLFVIPEAQAGGVGGAALAALDGLVRGESLHAFVLAGNDVSARLFERCGYRARGDGWYVRSPA